MMVKLAHAYNFHHNVHQHWTINTRLLPRPRLHFSTSLAACGQRKEVERGRDRRSREGENVLRIQHWCRVHVKIGQTCWETRLSAYRLFSAPRPQDKRETDKKKTILRNASLIFFMSFWAFCWSISAVHKPIFSSNLSQWAKISLPFHTRFRSACSFVSCHQVLLEQG